MWLGSEVMFFAGLFAIYFTLRSVSPELWAEQTAKLNVPYALVNTIILVLVVVHCQIGVFAAERLQPRRTGGAAPVLEVGHGRVVLPDLRPRRDLRRRPGLRVRAARQRARRLHSDSYGSAFYLTTGFHALHVTGGLIAFLLVIGRVFAVKNFSHKEATTAIVVSYYWHFVDVVWIGLFLVIYFLK